MSQNYFRSFDLVSRWLFLFALGNDVLRKNVLGRSTESFGRSIRKATGSFFGTNEVEQ